jgi:hypothetical protein
VTHRLFSFIFRVTLKVLLRGKVAQRLVKPNCPDYIGILSPSPAGCFLVPEHERNYLLLHKIPQYVSGALAPHNHLAWVNWVAAQTTWYSASGTPPQKLAQIQSHHP